MEHGFSSVPSLGSQPNGTRIEATRRGARGTFTLLWNVAFKATDDPDVVVALGAWALRRGTGDYAGLTGEGTSRGTCDFGQGIELNTLVGRVH